MEERLSLGFEALERALHRVSEYEPEQRFAPLAESLIWLVMINDAFWAEDHKTYQRERDSHADGRMIEGLRYARHRLVHDIRVYGLHGAMDYVDGYLDRYGDMTRWRWRDITELAPAERPQGEDEYREHLEGREVEPCLRDAASFLTDYYRNKRPPSG